MKISCYYGNSFPKICTIRFHKYTIQIFFINDNYDNLDNFFLAALLPMATNLSPINVVFVV